MRVARASVSSGHVQHACDAGLTFRCAIAPGLKSGTLLAWGFCRGHLR